MCADAEHKLAAAARTQRLLRDLRSEEALVAERRADGARLRDRRATAEAKDEAAREYRSSVSEARDQAGLQVAAAAWLRRVDQLNRSARMAAVMEEKLARRAWELHQLLPATELEAKAARIAAEAAQAHCVEARHSAIECEETGVASVAPPSAQLDSVVAHTLSAPPSALGPVAGTGLRDLLLGDRDPVMRLALQLATATGLEAGRLQLLLLEFREAITASALAGHALRFPPQHPFWSQFDQTAAIHVVDTLSSLGFRFDGSGWADGRVPQIRDLALALSYAGLDPRSLRRPAGQSAVDEIWHGTVLEPTEWLLQRAPDLALRSVVDALDQRAARLSDLWAIWAQVRQLLA